MTVGDNVRRLRGRAGWTQAELARRVGYKVQATLSLFEHSRKNPRPRTILKFATVLGCSAADLSLCQGGGGCGSENVHSVNRRADPLRTGAPSVSRTRDGILTTPSSPRLLPRDRSAPRGTRRKFSTD